MKPQCANRISRKIMAISILLSTALVIASCTKNTAAPPPMNTGNSFVAVVNASPTPSSYSVFSDGTNIFAGNTIAYGSTTGVAGDPYETIPAGTHALKLSANGTNFPVDSSFNFAVNNHYSVFAYDSANSSGMLRTLILKDNLTAPSNGNAEVRFINLSPNSQALNVSLINTDSMMIDSTLFSNVGYAGTTLVSSDSLASFRTITAGTYGVMLNSNAVESQNLFTAESVNFAAGRIYTIYSKGYVNGNNGTDSLGLGVIQNF